MELSEGPNEKADAKEKHRKEKKKKRRRKKKYMDRLVGAEWTCQTQRSSQVINCLENYYSILT